MGLLTSIFEEYLNRLFLKQPIVEMVLNTTIDDTISQYGVNKIFQPFECTYRTNVHDKPSLLRRETSSRENSLSFCPCRSHFQYFLTHETLLLCLPPTRRRDVHILDRQRIVMLIFVQSLDSTELITLTVESFDSITRLKQMIYRSKGILPEKLGLAFKGVELEDGRTVQFYNITKECVLHIFVPPPGPFPCQWIKEMCVGGQTIVKGPTRVCWKTEFYFKQPKHEVTDKNPRVPLDSGVLLTFCTPDEAIDPSETPSEVFGIRVRAFTCDNLYIKSNGVIVASEVIALPPSQIGLCPAEPFTSDTTYEIFLEAGASNGHFFRLKPDTPRRTTSYNLGIDGCSGFRRLGVWTFKTVVNVTDRPKKVTT